MKTEVRTLAPPRIAGDGTPELAWLESRQLRDLPEFTFPTCDLALVLAPHPDDETLGLGGTIANLLEIGSTVVIMTASDGEASHPRSATTAPMELRRRRASELRLAIDSLAGGRPGTALSVQLHLPDGGLFALEEEIRFHLLRFLNPHVLCFSTWEHDGHPDHEAVGRAARSACELSGARLMEYPVWTWHWAKPQDTTLPWGRARRVTLNSTAFRAKQNAIERYRSQIYPLSEAPGDEAILPPNDLVHFRRQFEVLFA